MEDRVSNVAMAAFFSRSVHRTSPMVPEVAAPGRAKLTMFPREGRTPPVR